jgi:hypothetical protein
VVVPNGGLDGSMKSVEVGQELPRRVRWQPASGRSGIDARYVVAPVRRHGCEVALLGVVEIHFCRDLLQDLKGEGVRAVSRLVRLQPHVDMPTAV